MRELIIQTTLTFATGIACVKQPVYAKLVTKDGKVFYGSNEMRAQGITTCPRVELGYASGEGYHHCKETCQQDKHAEHEAVQRAKDAGADTEGSAIYLVGHHYCCDNCMREMREAGVEKVVYVEDDNREEIL